MKAFLGGKRIPLDLINRVREAVGCRGLGSIAKRSSIASFIQWNQQRGAPPNARATFWPNLPKSTRPHILRECAEFLYADQSWELKTFGRLMKPGATTDQPRVPLLRHPLKRSGAAPASAHLQACNSDRLAANIYYRIISEGTGRSWLKEGPHIRTHTHLFTLFR